MGRQLGRQLKPPKTSTNFVVTSFIEFPFSVPHNIRDLMNKSPVKDRTVRSQGPDPVVLWAAEIVWGEREHTHLAQEVLAPRWDPLLFLTRPRRGKPHLNPLCCCCPQGISSCSPPFFQPQCRPLIPASLCLSPLGATDWGSDLC